VYLFGLCLLPTTEKWEEVRNALVGGFFSCHALLHGKLSRVCIRPKFPGTGRGHKGKGRAKAFWGMLGRKALKKNAEAKVTGTVGNTRAWNETQRSAAEWRAVVHWGGGSFVVGKVSSFKASLPLKRRPPFVTCCPSQGERESGQWGNIFSMFENNIA